MDDTSLDDFLDSEADADDTADATSSEADEGGSTGDETGDAAGPRVDPASVDPAVTTAEWVPEGAVCQSCRETVQRCWRDDGQRVCAACKEW